MTTTPAVSDGVTLQEAARQSLIALLSGDTDAWSLAKGLNQTGDTARLFGALNDLTSTRDELQSEMASAEREFAYARAFINGGLGTLNRRGILQAQGSRIDVLAATFHLQIDAARTLLYAAHEAEGQDS